MLSYTTTNVTAQWLFKFHYKLIGLSCVQFFCPTSQHRHTQAQILLFSYFNCPCALKYKILSSAASFRNPPISKKVVQHHVAALVHLHEGICSFFCLSLFIIQNRRKHYLLTVKNIVFLHVELQLLIIFILNKSASYFIIN